MFQYSLVWKPNQRAPTPKPHAGTGTFKASPATPTIRSGITTVTAQSDGQPTVPFGQWCVAPFLTPMSHHQLPPLRQAEGWYKTSCALQLAVPLQAVLPRLALRRLLLPLELVLPPLLEEVPLQLATPRTRYATRFGNG